MASQNITYKRNTTYPINVNYAAASAIHGVKALFTAKQQPQDSNTTDTSAIVQKDITLAAGSYTSANYAQAIADNIADTGTTNINPTDVADTIPPGKYYYDILIVDTSGAIYPFAQGNFILTAGPTNRDT